MGNVLSRESRDRKIPAAKGVNYASTSIIRLCVFPEEKENFDGFCANLSYKYIPCDFTLRGGIQRKETRLHREMLILMLLSRVIKSSGAEEKSASSGVSYGTSFDGSGCG
jgi:hypothetical protein